MSTCTCCGLCRKSRHETYVDDVFPREYQATPVDSEMGKLIYYAKASPNNLNRIAEYLLVKLRRAMARGRYNQVEVAVLVMLRLLSASSPQQVPHLADSLLTMVHLLLERDDTRLQVLACNTFASFCAVKEVSPLYHSVHYEFFVDRFAGLALASGLDGGDVQKCYDIRISGLKGLQGMLAKASASSGLQYNIWDSNCMNKLVPALLLNMEITDQQRVIPVRDSNVGQLVSFSEEILKELVSSAGLGHIESVLKPVLDHLDDSNCWEAESLFAQHIFGVIMDSVQDQFRYKVISALIYHLDQKRQPRMPARAKQGVLATISVCMELASEGFLGPSAMDVFTVLLKQTKASIDDCTVRTASIEQLKQDNPVEYQLQKLIIATIGSVSRVLPDYDKNHVMSLIVSYIPEQYTEENVKAFVLSYQLLGCLREVVLRYSTHNWTKTFPDTLFVSIKKLFTTKGTVLQLIVLEVLQCLMDNHSNRNRIPLNTNWSTLDEVCLVYGTEGSSQFMKKHEAEFFKLLVHYCKLLSPHENLLRMYYQLLAIVVLECSKNMLKDCFQMAIKLQDMALKDSTLAQPVRVCLHCIVSGLMHLFVVLSGYPKLQAHVEAVLEERRRTHQHLLIDNYFKPDVDFSLAESSSECVDDSALFSAEKAKIQDLEVHSSPLNPYRSSFHAMLLKQRNSVSDTGSTHSLEVHMGGSVDVEQVTTYHDIVAGLDAQQPSSLCKDSATAGTSDMISAGSPINSLDIKKLCEGDSTGTRISVPKSAFDVELPDV